MRRRHPPQKSHPISYIKQPCTKFYKVKGAKFRGWVTAIYVAADVDVITDCDDLRTTEEEISTERERVVTMSAVSP